MLFYKPLLQTASLNSSKGELCIADGFLIFWLFANRLIFGYGAVADIAASILNGEEKEFDKEEFAKKTGKTVEEIDNLSKTSLLILWKSSLEPFKYAFYFGFVLVFSFALLLGLNIITSVTFGPIIEGFVLGASVPSLLVWIMELMADAYVASLIRINSAA